MDNAARVGGGQPLCDLHPDLERFPRGKGAAGEPRPQRLALEELLDDVRCTFVRADVVNGEDVRVVERRCRPRLALEPLQALRVGREFRWQDFDRHVAPEPRVASAPYFAHPAGTDGGDDLIRPESGAGVHGSPLLQRGYTPAEAHARSRWSVALPDGADRGKLRLE